MMAVRTATETDQTALGAVAEAVGLFPAASIPDMIAPALAGGSDIWLVWDRDATIDSLAYARPEEMTDRVWNVLALGVAPQAHGKGVGRTLLGAVEARLPDAGLLIVETTHLPEQEAARAPHTAAGFREQGRVPEFYADGEDKIIYAKRIGARA